MITAIITALIMLALSGLAERYKDLSSEGKLGTGFWNKNHPAQVFTQYPLQAEPHWQEPVDMEGESLWWDVHWLQGPTWNRIPRWIRRYLSFRCGWHLLKFFSVNLWAAAYGVLLSPFIDIIIFGQLAPFTGFWIWLMVRLTWSSPETILRAWPQIRSWIRNQYSKHMANSKLIQGGALVAGLIGLLILVYGIITWNQVDHYPQHRFWYVAFLCIPLATVVGIVVWFIRRHRKIRGQ